MPPMQVFDKTRVAFKRVFQTLCFKLFLYSHLPLPGDAP